MISLVVICTVTTVTPNGFPTGAAIVAWVASTLWEIWNQSAWFDIFWYQWNKTEHTGWPFEVNIEMRDILRIE